jgi:ribosomal protein S27AE
MVFLSDIIKAHISAGLRPVLIPGQEVILLFECTHCGALKKMVKFTQPSTKAKKHVCGRCGYTHYTKAWQH